MAEMKSSAGISFKLNLILNEPEARALRAIVQYGDEAFLRVFYEHLGKAYLGKHEAGLKSLFKTISDELPMHLERIDESRKLFIKNK